MLMVQVVCSIIGELYIMKVSCFLKMFTVANLLSSGIQLVTEGKWIWSELMEG